MKRESFILAVLSQAEAVAAEDKALTALLEAGLMHLHLRKPQWSTQEMCDLIHKIPLIYHSRIHLHGHVEVLNHYELGGFHLNANQETCPEKYEGKLSYSCHSLSQVVKNKPLKEYVFLSPIFDSISKQGYQSGFAMEEIEKAAGKGYIDRKVLALGGLNCERFQQVWNWGFGGAVVLGALWEHYKTPKDLPALLHQWNQMKEFALKIK